MMKINIFYHAVQRKCQEEIKGEADKQTFTLRGGVNRPLLWAAVEQPVAGWLAVVWLVLKQSLRFYVRMIIISSKDSDSVTNMRIPVDGCNP